MDKKTWLGVIVLIIVAAVGVWWFVFHNKKVTSLIPNLGSQISEQSQNPIKNKVPETNPFKTEANPFAKDLNPFNESYTNPFSK